MKLISEKVEELQEKIDKLEREKDSLKLDMIRSFEYIEKVRAYACNKKGKRLLKKERLADLYFAGLFLISNRKSWSDLYNERIDNIIDAHKNDFKLTEEKEIT